jgi:hypothetical protein
MRNIVVILGGNARGTTFSRKDKLMGHVGLFVGHHPVINGLSYSTHTN